MRSSTPARSLAFAEVVIAAPWALRLLRNDQDNDKGYLLHRNMEGDEWSSTSPVFNVLALERAARAERARILGAAFSSLWRRIATHFRPRARA